MKKIVVRNFRSLENTDEIIIKPLTVLVGKNSVGKSTFLRMFPLFKQSLGIDRSEPLLWYSPELVDFGSFKETVFEQDTKRSIEFEFEFEIETKQFFPVLIFSSRFGPRYFPIIDFKEKEDIYCDINLKISINEKRISKFSFSIFDYNYEIQTNTQSEIVSFTINGIKNPINKKFDKLNSFLAKKILPEISLSLENKKFANSSSMKKIKTYEDEINQLLEQQLSRVKNGRISEKRIYEIIDSIKFDTKKKFSDSFTNELGKIKTMKKIFETFNKKEQEDFLEYLYILNGFKYVNLAMELINSYIYDYFENVQYIAPIRASAQRYYRIQGLSMSDITPQGENVPMILNNMKYEEKKDWNKWTDENFGVKFDVIESEANLSLKLIKNDHEINLADTGFGYSQLLPILLYAWKASKEKNKENIGFNKFSSNIKTLVIEQPELHLHPALQATLVDIFIDIISRLDKMNFFILMETHSEYMINRIGQHIALTNYNLAEDDVNILLFDEKNNKNRIRQTKFAREGYLKNWPIDFFLPDYVSGVRK